MIGIGYIRRSKESKIKTISLKAQEEIINDYCTRTGITLAKVICDDGVSGTKRKRFTALHAAFKETNADCFLFYNLDRVARDNAGLTEFVKQLVKRNVALHEAGGAGVMDVSTALGILMLSVRGAFDEYFAALTGEKVKVALRYNRVRDLQYTRIPPFGFYHQEGKLLQHPEEQAARAQVLELRALGISINKTIFAVRATGYAGRLGRTLVHSLSPPRTG